MLNPLNWLLAPIRAIWGLGKAALAIVVLVVILAFLGGGGLGSCAARQSTLGELRRAVEARDLPALATLVGKEAPAVETALPKLLPSGGGTTGGVFTATIQLAPTSGPPGTHVTLTGQNWQQKPIKIYLASPGSTGWPENPVTTILPNIQGVFNITVTIPADWFPGDAWIGALSEGMTEPTAVRFTVTAPTSGTPTPTMPPTAATPTPAATAPKPGIENGPMVTAIDGVNIRLTPSMGGEVIGLLKNGDSAVIVGKSTDGLWWQISWPSAPGGKGWVTAKPRYTTAQGTGTVPVVQ